MFVFQVFSSSELCRKYEIILDHVSGIVTQCTCTDVCTYSDMKFSVRNRLFTDAIHDLYLGSCVFAVSGFLRAVLLNNL